MMSNGFDLEGFSLEQLAEAKYSLDDQEVDYQEEDIDLDSHDVENIDDDDYNADESDDSITDSEEPEDSQDSLPEEEEDLSEEQTEDSEEETLTDDDSVWAEISKPFKANGKMMTVSSPQEAIRLMQMGIGSQPIIQEYNANRPLIKALQENDLLDEGTINLMIEAKKGNLGAYKSLLTTLGFDEEQFDDLQYSEELDGYQPQNHIKSAEALNFKDSLDNLDTNYPEVSDKVKQTLVSFQDGSLNLVSRQPEILEVLANITKNGFMDEVLAETEKAYLLGYVPENINKIQVLDKIVGELGKQKGVNLITGEPLEAETNKPNSNRVSTKRRTVKRRSAGRSPESTVSKYSNDSENDIVAQIDKAVAQGDYETQKRLVEQYYGIQIG